MTSLMEKITNLTNIKELIKDETTIMVYFTTDSCSVCHVLQPKLEAAISAHFPKIKMVTVNSGDSPGIAGQYSVFTSPVLLVFFEGQEYLRKAQSFGVNEVIEAIQRPYSLLFD